MRPEISQTLMRHFYKDLQDADSVSHYLPIMGMVKSMFFLSHTEQEDKMSEDRTSYMNTFEVHTLTHSLHCRSVVYSSTLEYGKFSA